MMGEGTRYKRADHQLVARVREAREQLDQVNPDWHRERLDQLRAARRAVQHG